METWMVVAGYIVMTLATTLAYIDKWNKADALLSFMFGVLWPITITADIIRRYIRTTSRRK